MAKSKDSEYRELFLVEALDNFEELNKLFIDLEKDHANKNAINSIFRITHTLKGNAMGLGLNAIAELSHVMEDVMGAIKSGKIILNGDLFKSLFTANDKLGGLIRAIQTGEKISYLGIKTKLSVIYKNAIEDTAVEVRQPEETLEQAAGGEEEMGPEITFAEFIQIPVKKLDEMMNLVGQLVIERDRLIAANHSQGKRTSQFEVLQRISSNLQYSIMNARMVQMGFLFNKFHRIVRDAAAIENKQVDLMLKGTEIEIDRNILKIMSDSLIHLVRNAVSHGIESPEMRKKMGKPETGCVTLNSRYEKDNVVIIISDDGNGIDAHAIREKIVKKGLVSAEVAERLDDSEVIRYIFEPGFSNAEKVTEISGRGVGMDVVKKAVESIGGQVTVETQIGKGSTISLLLPSSLALKGALLFELNEQEYAVALAYTKSVISLRKSEIHRISGGLMAKYLDETISVVFLNDLVSLKSISQIHEKGVLHRTFDRLEGDPMLDVIVVSYSGKTTGIVIDRFLQQKEIIEKKLPKPLEHTRLLSGTTILGNGKVCPVIDIGAITDVLYKSLNQTGTSEDRKSA